MLLALALVHYAAPLCSVCLSRYLLEKSRIVWQAPGERNFHIFIEMFELPQELKTKYHLTQPEEFHYINQGGSIRADGWNDKEEMGMVRAAFKRLGVSETEIFDIVAALLWLGQVTFAGARGQDATVAIEDPSVVNRAATLLGLAEDDFARTLTSRKVKAGRDVVTTPLNYEQACAARDGIAKHVYNQLFDHITAEINRGVDRVRTAEKVRPDVESYFDTMTSCAPAGTDNNRGVGHIRIRVFCDQLV